MKYVTLAKDAMQSDSMITNNTVNIDRVENCEENCFFKDQFNF